MKTRRNTGGFTLLELALAVAVIAILSSVTAVNVVHYQRTLTQVELDGIAREIFVAAQNHLTMAESQGFTDVSDWGTEYESDAAPEMYYHVVNSNIQRESEDMLRLMLPFASVDETVLEVGSYVIRYQKNPALVLDVFYARKTGKFCHRFDADNEVTSDWIQDYRGPDNKQRRGSYPEETGGAIIGWYGVEPQETPVSTGAPLSPPTIKIVNAEQLYVEVTNQNVDVTSKFRNARLNLEISSTDGTRKCSIPLIDGVGQAVDDKDYIIPLGEFGDPSKFYVILDDVTQDTARFYKLMKELHCDLYPGEDIIIRAVAYNNTELTNIATSASSTTNSLFALPIENTKTASIANFRHLENLDFNISHVDIPIAKASQTSDMDWTKFVDNIKALKKEEGKAETAEVYSDSTNSKDGYYLPIQNQGKIEYTGELTENGATRAAKISNVKIDVSGDAGLFATLGHDSTVTDLELVNFSVDSNGNAGALAGVLQENSTVQRVLVHHDPDPNLPDKNKTIQSKGNKHSAGGLIGLINGACTVTQSAAAVYVKSTSNTGNAGGLIGKIHNDSDIKSVTVSDSYAGGHTKHNYSDTVKAGYQGDYYRIEEQSATQQGHYNVTARASAGGLIGTSTGNLTVENCYATTSVKADANAGGFIGEVTGGTITDCYVTGYVTGGTNKGAFAGKVNGSGTSFSDGDDSNSGYFTAPENESKPLPPVGEGNGNDITSFDQDYGKYGYYVQENAKPYDEDLSQRYAFQTISEWANYDTVKLDTAPDWITKHYGDWPLWNEALVVNELAS